MNSKKIHSEQRSRSRGRGGLRSEMAGQEPANVIPIRYESIGAYEYSQSDLIGHGAFAIVYKGREKLVSHI